MAAPRGRIAPSPTGEVHLGNASTALLAWLSIRARGGTMVMRMEDLDRNRVRPGLAERILQDLAWLGLDWDEGPDRGGPHAPYEQWSRRTLYREAFAKLHEAGHLYRCFCSRKDVAAAASAPQTPGEEVRYAGTCRSLGANQAHRRAVAGERHAWRFHVPSHSRPGLPDLVRGRWGDGLPPPGDFVVWRSDEVPAYQLAVVVDDLEMGMTEVVRGDDLLPSTARQAMLYEAMGHPLPAFGHVPLLLGSDGVRLSKRHRSVTLRELRASGFTPDRVLGHLTFRLGLRRTAAPVAARDLVAGFALDSIRPVPKGIVVDPRHWD